MMELLWSPNSPIRTLIPERDGHNEERGRRTQGRKLAFAWMVVGLYERIFDWVRLFGTFDESPTDHAEPFSTGDGRRRANLYAWASSQHLLRGFCVCLNGRSFRVIVPILIFLLPPSSTAEE